MYNETANSIDSKIIKQKIDYEETLKKRILNLNELAKKYEKLGNQYLLRKNHILDEADVLSEILEGVSDIKQWTECYEEDLEEYNHQ